MKIKKKNIVTFLLALILMVAFSSSAFAATSSSEYVSSNPPGPGFTGWCIVTAQPSLTVRSGAGANYSPVGSELYGNSVDVILVNNTGWAEISIGSNVTGWVSTSYLTID